MRTMITFGTMALALVGSHADAAAVQWRIQDGGNGHFYEVVSRAGISWPDAQAAALNAGGYLATVTSVAENDFIWGLIPHVVNPGLLQPEYWLGGFQDGSELVADAGWTWVSGEPFASVNGVLWLALWHIKTSPSDWANTQPDDFSAPGNEQYLGIGLFGDSTWNDEGNPGIVYGYVVEFDHDPNDSDHDGIADSEDACPNSDLTPTVVVGGCDSGAPNRVLASGCTISDLIAGVAAGAKNHGSFVSGVAHLTQSLKASGVLTGQEKGAIDSCAAKSAIP